LGIKIQCSTPIANIFGLSRRRVSVEALEGIDVDARSADYSVIVVVSSSEMEDDAVEGSASISYEEIDRVTAAIDRLKLAHRGMTRFKSFTAYYDGIEALRIGVFSQSDQTLTASISAEKVVAFVQPVSRLEELKNALISAKDYITRNRIA
jgi:hypothetical protein